jgi:hypothetical protein
MNHELTALQNATSSIRVFGIKVNEKYIEDKRKKKKMYFLTIFGNSISPVLDYDNMNHFILGFSKAITLTN